MKRCLVVVSYCIIAAAMLAYAQGGDEGYQTATVATIEKLANDGKHPANVDRYKISMRMEDTIYICRASAPAATFMEWVVGKEFPAKENGKVLAVKNTDGRVVELEITGKKKPK